MLALGACTTAEPRDAAPSEAPSPTSSPSATAPVDLDALVDDPDARIVSSTVRRDDPSVRSIVWSLCRTPRCYRSDQVLAVTDDGFATRHLVAKSRDTWLTPLDGVYLLTRGRSGVIVQPDGSRTTVAWEAAPPGPVRTSEHAVGTHRFGKIHAVDPLTGTGHLVPTPFEAMGAYREVSGALSTIVEGEHNRTVWSYDGGRTWDERGAFVWPRGRLTGTIQSATTTRAVITGGDGATVLPINELHVDDGSGWRSFPGPEDPVAFYGNGGAVLPNGRLLLSIMSWSDSVRHRPSSRPAGLWISAGRDWSDLSPVPMGAPFDTLDLRRDEPPILDIVVAPRKVTVYAVLESEAGQTLWSSTDTGRTWTEVTAR